MFFLVFLYEPVKPSTGWDGTESYFSIV